MSAQNKKIVLKTLKQHKTIWHPESTLVYKSKEERVVIGRYDDGELIPLDETALDLCEEWGSKFPPDESLLAEGSDDDDDDSDGEEKDDKSDAEQETAADLSETEENPKQVQDPVPDPVEENCDTPPLRAEESSCVLQSGADALIEQSRAHKKNLMDYVKSAQSQETDLRRSLEELTSKHASLQKSHDAMKKKFDAMKSFFS